MAEDHPSEQIEADPYVEDETLELETIRSETGSLTSSIFDYVYENGRRYNAYRAGHYDHLTDSQLMPNDEKEQDRLDLTHHLFQLVLKGALYASDLQNPQKILDVGTGTGIWAIEMGDLFPSAVVIGTDLSPIQSQWVPPNVKFEIDDLESDWTFTPGSFDFIHARCLGGSVHDWPGFLEQCYRHLKPGGQVEIAEGRTNLFCDDGTFPEDCATRLWVNELNRLAELVGTTFDIIPHVPQMLIDIGFEDIETLDKPMPIGSWPKDPHLKQVGRVFRLQFLEGEVDCLSGYTLALFTRNGWTEAECQVLYAKVRNEIRTNSMHIYGCHSHVMARKPI